MQKFKAKKKGFVIYLLIASILPVVILYGNKNSLTAIWFELLLGTLPLLLLLWVYFSTSYWIKDTNLHYRSAFISGKINIFSIQEVELNKTLWVGLKPALATKGMIIKYDTYEEIYLAPIHNETLAHAIIQINPDIKIVNHT